MTPEQIEAKWRKCLEEYDEDDVDQRGENPDFPDRVKVKTKDYKNEFKQRPNIERVTRATGDSKKGNADEEFEKHKAEMMLGREKEGIVSPAKKAARTGGPALGQASPQPKLGDVGIQRLRASEEQRDELCTSIHPNLAASIRVAEAAIPEDRSDMEEFLGVIDDRAKVAKAILSTYEAAVPVDPFKTAHPDTLPTAEEDKQVKRAASACTLHPCTSPEVLVCLPTYDWHIAALKKVSSQSQTQKTSRKQ